MLRSQDAISKRFNIAVYITNLKYQLFRVFNRIKSILIKIDKKILRSQSQINKLDTNCINSFIVYLMIDD